MLLHPGHVLVDVGGVDHEEKVVLAHLVYQQVVYSASVGIAHHAVEDLADGGVFHIVGEDVVHIPLGIGALDAYLTHVRYIEHTAVLAHGVMLLDDG